MNEKDRRRETRTYSTVPLDLYDPKGRYLIGEGRFINVSLTGSLLESRFPLQLDQTIRLQVQTPGKTPFAVAGRVIWRKRKADTFNYGIRFQALSKQELAQSAYKEVA